MPEPADKVRRQREIQQLVRAGSFESQQALADALLQRGHRVTQATLSRDLRDLGILRVPVNGGYRYQAGSEARPEAGDAPQTQRLRSVAALEVLGIDANETCIVVRTLTGRAQGVAVWIDGLKLPDVLGTIAGDDTILIVPRSVRRTTRLEARLAEVLGLRQRGAAAAESALSRRAAR